MGAGPRGVLLPSEFLWRRHKELLGMEGGALQEKAHFPSCFSHTSARTVTIYQGRQVSGQQTSTHHRFPFRT